MQALVSFAAVIAITTFLALPGVVAILRKHPSWVAITLLTLVLGWTGLGWAAALRWATRPIDRRRQDKTRWLGALMSKVRSRRHIAPAAAPLWGGANDNASTPMRVTAEPDAIAPTAYEDWLDRGQALQGAHTATGLAA